MKKQNGQALVMVILAMVVALTIGLSVASRSITNIKISKNNEESQRALQAAEAGIQQALRTAGTSGTIVSGNFTGNSSTFNAQIQDVEGSDILLNDGNEVDQDKGIDLWLSEYPNYTNPLKGKIEIYWSNPSQSCSQTTGDSVSAALEVAILSGDKNSPTFEKYFFDPCDRVKTPDATTNVSAGPGNVIDGESFSFRATVNYSDGLIVKIIPIFNSSRIGVKNFDDSNNPLFLHSQGKTVESFGTSGDTIRRINYFQPYPQIPVEIFPYSIISQN